MHREKGGTGLTITWKRGILPQPSERVKGACVEGLLERSESLGSALTTCEVRCIQPHKKEVRFMFDHIKIWPHVITISDHIWIFITGTSRKKMLKKRSKKGQKWASTISGRGIYGVFAPEKHQKKWRMERIRLFTTKNDRKKICGFVGVVEAAGSSLFTQATNPWKASDFRGFFLVFRLFFPFAG